jgi:GNAT superfamily N-acetyltransferase
LISLKFTGNVFLDIPDTLRPIKMGEEDITNRLWELAGAFDGATIKVRINKIITALGKTDAIVLKVIHPDLLERPMVRRLLFLEDGKVAINIIENVEFYLKEEFRGQGIGRICLITEALAANQLGFSKIITNAANHPDIGWVV